MGRVIPIARTVKKRQLAEKLLDACGQVRTVVIEHDPVAPRTVKLTMYDIAEVVEIEEEFEGEKNTVSLTLDELALIGCVALPPDMERKH